ncbi:MAG: hypothetical protein NC218_09950 [Acetobacter sp.]|nr:hypothetical protein [Acetobacter sp.]
MAFFTRWEVWKFFLNSNHRIPEEHHINMVEHRGCSKQTLLDYMLCGHHLSNQAFNHLVNTCGVEFLPALCNKHALQLSTKQKALLVERFGAKTLLKNGLNLSSEYIRNALEQNKTDSICEHINHLTFSDEDAKLLLSLRNTELTKAFIKKNPYFANTHFSLIAQHNSRDVFEAYFKHGHPLPEARTEIISKLPPYVFALMLQSLSQENLNISFEEFKLLIDRDNLKMLEIYFQHHSIHQNEYIQYICENASDAVFAYCIEKGVFAYTSGYEYERLLKSSNRDLVLQYLTKHRIYDADAEIKVLQSGDEEYINTYCSCINSCFQEDTQIWIWLQGLGEKFGLSLTELPPCYWQLETKIFTSGDEKLIEQYLFSGKTYFSGLTDFGEALLFLNAPLKILDAYLEEKNLPSPLAQKAIVTRCNLDLFSLYLDKHNNEFCNEVVVDFLTQASSDLVLKYLNSLENMENFLCTECPQALHPLCERGDNSIYRFILDKHILLEDDDCALFIRYAPVQMVMELCDHLNGFEDVAETELLRHPDDELVKHYLSKYTLSECGEKALIERFQPELITLYFTGDLSDYSKAEYYLS